MALASAIATAAPDAVAHGGIPRAYEILVEPDNEAHMLLRSYLWGFFDTRDGGGTWQYTCAEAYRGRSTTAQTRSIAMVPGGRVLVANYFEGLQLSDDGCNWRKHADFPEPMITDVRLDPHAQGRLYLASTLGGATGFDSKLFRSDDRGDTWQVAATLPRDFSPSHLGFGSADPNTLYVAGKGYNNSSSFFLRSRDRGATFERFELPIQRDRWLPRMRAIHPRRPGVIFIWVDGEEELNENNADEYLVTADEGATWKRLFQGTGDLPGFAISPDGTKVLIGGALDGIQEADLDRALIDGPAAFAQIYPHPVWSLSFVSEGLLAGGNNYGATGDPEFMLGLSTDGGRTFTPLMTICDVKFSQCPAESTVGQMCTEVWETTDEQPGFDEEYVKVRCGGSATKDGGGGTSPVPDGGVGASGGSGNGATTGLDDESGGDGCGCRTPARGRLADAAPLGVALLLGLHFRRRRRSGTHGS